MQADDPRHNSTAGYVAGCRESCCRAAIAAWMKHYRTRRYLHGHQQIDGLGTRRRIRALMALGWSTAVLDAELGKARTYTTALLRRNGPVYVTTAQQYAALYERLSMTLPPDETRYQRQFASRARNLARRNGWPPPLAWDDIDDPNERPQGARRDWHRGPGHDSLDHAVVERLLLGERLPSTKAERTEAMRQMACEWWVRTRIHHRPWVARRTLQGDRSVRVENAKGAIRGIRNGPNRCGNTCRALPPIDPRNERRLTALCLSPSVLATRSSSETITLAATPMGPFQTRI